LKPKSKRSEKMKGRNCECPFCKKFGRDKRFKFYMICKSLGLDRLSRTRLAVLRKKIRDREIW
jgi:hypothetical protein